MILSGVAYCKRVESMFLKSFEITPQALITEIVAHDYRTSDVFRKYGIGFCCGGKWPLETACMLKGIKTEELIKELKQATRSMQLPANIPFGEWRIEFPAPYYESKLDIMEFKR